MHFAGEVQAENGDLRVITSKSGHYKPTTTQLVAMLRFLQVYYTYCQIFLEWMIPITAENPTSEHAHVDIRSHHC